MYLPKARPPEGIFKCSGHKFTNQPKWEHLGISYKLSLKFHSEIFFPLHKTDKNNNTTQTKLQNYATKK